MLGDAYITINKRMFEELVDNIPARLQDQMRVFMFHLLYNANYADKGNLKRGQLFITTTVSTLSEQTVRSLLGHLKSNEQVTSKATNRGRILTIVKYDSWVMSEKQSNDQSNEQVTTTEVNHRTIEPKQQQSKNQTVVVANDSVSALAEVVIEMGLPNAKQTYSWIGGLRKKTSHKICKEVLEQFALEGKHLSDFDDAKGFKSYITKSIISSFNGGSTGHVTSTSKNWHQQIDSRH
jgi:hypothetical protein